MRYNPTGRDTCPPSTRVSIERCRVPTSARLLTPHPGPMRAEQIGCDPAQASFFIGREVPVPALRPDLPY